MKCSPRALLLALALVAGCGGGSQPAGDPPRLVILYATCSLNRETIAPYGDVRYTPHLARFAEGARVFRRHSTASGQSGTDFATLFSGTQANVHGIYMHPAELPADLRLITETFGEAGWEPHFWSGHAMATHELGYGQGVADEHAHSARGRAKQRILQDEDPDFGALLDELAANPEKRAFVMANFTMTHSPYQKMVGRDEVDAFLREFPEVSQGVTSDELDRWLAVYDAERMGLEWDFPATVARLGLGEAEIGRLAAVLDVVYRTSVRRLDAAFGEMLADLERRGLADDALIVFTSDHGEVLYRENALFQWTHGLQLAPEDLTIALLMRAPGLAPGDYEAVTRSIDVYPTMAGWCGAPIPADERPDGVDLSSVLRGEREPPDLYALSHSTTLSDEHLTEFRKHELGLVLSYFPRTDPNLIWVRVRRGDTVAKLVDSGGGRFVMRAFDLAADPGEARDLFDPSNPEHAELERILRGYKQALVAGFEARGGQGLSAEQRLGALKELGYVGED